jgi:hypothetical protein
MNFQKNNVVDWVTLELSAFAEDWGNWWNVRKSLRGRCLFMVLKCSWALFIFNVEYG